MILAYPLLLLAAAALAASRRATAGGRGWPWFGVWAVTGAVFTFSFLTGLSVGLLILPLAAALLLWSAWSAPRAAEASGFVLGLGAILLLVAAIGHGDRAPWLVAGLLAAAASGAGALLARRSSGSGV